MNCGTHLETIEPYPTPPWETPLGEIENLGLEKESAAQKIKLQVKEETAQGSMIIFTDGSHLQETGGGAAIALQTEAKYSSYVPPNGISNYKMEAIAQSIALNYSIEAIGTNKAPINSTFAVFSDSQSALHLMNNPMMMKPVQYIARHLQELIQKKSPEHTVRLYWKPGHHDMELNETADEMEKRAAEAEGERNLLPFSLSCTHQHVKKLFNTRGGEADRVGFKTTGKNIAEGFNRLEKGQAAAIFST